jgi:phospholipid N-methyltransferase
MLMLLTQTLAFFRQYLAAPRVIGAVAPSSRGLANALAGPFSRRCGPAAVLEVGAGTGSVTRVLGKHLGEKDRLDVCEIDETLAGILQRSVLDSRVFEAAREEGRVRLIYGPVQEIDAPNTYDFVISSLPFNAFSLVNVQGILAVIKRNLKSGGVLSYFEYVGLRRLRGSLAGAAKKAEVRAVSRYLSEQVWKHQIARQTIWFNLPPAHARHLRFEE